MFFNSNIILSINSHINNYNHSSSQKFAGAQLGMVIFCIIVAALITFVKLSKIQYMDSGNVRKKFDHGDFTNILILLSASVIKADGRIYRKEKQMVHDRIRRNFKGYEMQKLISDLEICLKKKIKIETICKTVLINFTSTEKVQLMNFLISIATSDKKLTDNEYFTLNKIAKNIGMSRRSLVSIFAMFTYTRINDFEKKSKSRSKTTKRTSYSELERAFKVLEISSDSDVDEIKKAYRKMAKLHHPDLVAHLGKQQQNLAKIKFQKVSSAYELIKSKRKFS